MKVGIIFRMEVSVDNSSDNLDPKAEQISLSQEWIRRLDSERPGFLNRSANHLKILSLFLQLPEPMQLPIAKALAVSMDLVAAELNNPDRDTTARDVSDYEINRKLSATLYSKFGNSDSQREIDSWREILFGIITLLGKFEDLRSLTIVTEDMVGLASLRQE